MLAQWFYHPARWWQVWLPQSGLTGGAIVGIAILGLVWLIY